MVQARPSESQDYINQLQMAEIQEAIQEEDHNVDYSPEQQYPRMRRNFDDDGVNSDELAITFDEYARNRQSAQYIARMESRQQLSGFVFCCIGTIILVFGSWLIKRGNNSHRTDELFSYVADVANWENFYREQFQDFNIKLTSLTNALIPIDQEVGPVRSEIDVAVALGRLPRQALQKQLSTKDLYYDFGRRLELSTTDYSKVPKKDLKIEYVPVRYFLNITPTEDQDFIETIHSLQVSKSTRTMKINVDGQELESSEFLTLTERKHFSKNHHSCSVVRGLEQGANCITFYKVSHICLYLDHDDDNQFRLTSLCGLQYDEKLYDSSEPVQEVQFYDYPIEVEIRSTRDPHIRFGKATKGKFTMDESANQLKWAGSLLLLFAFAMLGCSLYKTYRFCVKYTCKDWLTERRRKQYREEEQEEQQNDDQEQSREQPADQAQRN